MNDRHLRQKVIDALDWEPSLDSADIAVAADCGVVTLSGHVPTFAQKAVAEAVVKRIKGVRGIAQDIEVAPDGAVPHSDEDIAKRAVMAISFDVTIPANSVQVRVSRGWITLTGEVAWQYQRLAAEGDVRKLAGVVGITNSITLAVRASAKDVEERIRKALERDAALDAGEIQVRVVGETVTLEGAVDCWRDRELVERTAWAAPGVRTVVDHLHVS